METLSITKKETVEEQKITLIDGTFNPSDAADIINAVLDVKINFHKLKRLSIIEGNSEDLCEYDSGRIHELLKAKEAAKQFFKDVRLQGQKLNIDSSITISVKE